MAQPPAPQATEAIKTTSSWGAKKKKIFFSGENFFFFFPSNTPRERYAKKNRRRPRHPTDSKFKVQPSQPNKISPARDPNESSASASKATRVYYRQDRRPDHRTFLKSAIYAHRRSPECGADRAAKAPRLAFARLHRLRISNLASFQNRARPRRDSTPRWASTFSPPGLEEQPGGGTRTRKPFSYLTDSLPRQTNCPATSATPTKPSTT